MTVANVRSWWIFLQETTSPGLFLLHAYVVACYTVAALLMLTAGR